MTRRKARWVNRTCKNGRVKINGRYFAPSQAFAEYDGRFEGMRLVFGLYFDNLPDTKIETMVDFVYLWGTEAYYDALVKAEWNHDKTTIEIRKDTEIMVKDGILPWLWWNEEAENGI